MGAIKPLKSSPPFVAKLADKINELVLTANKVEGMKAGTGVTLTISESGIMISASGMPKGYGPEAWTVYDGGVVTTRNFITNSPD
jgi:hypothetical protein